MSSERRGPRRPRGAPDEGDRRGPRRGPKREAPDASEGRGPRRLGGPRTRSDERRGPRERSDASERRGPRERSDASERRGPRERSDASEHRGPPREAPGARDARRRAPLEHQGGEVEARGDDDVAEILARALEASEGERDTLTHGFHSYPARMHPAIAATLLDDLAGEGERVLDPFCGSGTVLVETRVRGLAGRGVDLNPLALRIAEVKTDVRGAADRARFLALVRAIGARSEERVRGRVDARAPVTPREASWWAPHVLKELAGLREEIREVAPTASQEARERPDVRDRRALEVVLSSLLVKVSKQRADTAERTSEKRIRKGLTTELFVRKGEELVERWASLAEACGPTSPPTRLTLGDASRLPHVLSARYDLVVSSPPYGGTYDYVDHHARRYPWLDLDPSGLRRGELGARRDLRDEADERRWDAQVVAFLRSLRGVIHGSTRVVLLVGDAQLGRRRVDAAEQLAELAPHADLVAVAAASQRRPDWMGYGDRREHLVALAPSD